MACSLRCQIEAQAMPTPDFGRDYLPSCHAASPREMFSVVTHHVPT